MRSINESFTSPANVRIGCKFGHDKHSSLLSKMLKPTKVRPSWALDGIFNEMLNKIFFNNH